MNLIIDVGNTNIKIALYASTRCLKKEIVSYDEFQGVVKELFKKYQSINRAIISSVGRLEQEQMVFLKQQVTVLELNNTTKVPFGNNYKTPKTLGVDRIALVSASVNQYPDSNVLIIDAGTCITYDFVNSQNVYLGGAISPGIRLRYKTLNNLTANLPLLDTKAPKTLIGNSTESSIHSGVINGVICELDGIVKEYKTKYLDLTVILTGGDAKFLSKRLKSSIVANSNFLLEGLNHILEYNTIQIK
jgi:type III pantothenate kinase